MVSSEYYVADNSDTENKKLEAAKNHYSTGNYDAALKLYLSMLNTNLSYKLYHRIGKCYYKMNDFKHALEYFQKSAEMEKDSNPSFLYLGNIYYKNEDIKKAIYNWACAFANKPEDETICLNLATSYFSLGMKFQSIFYYEKYLKYAQQNSESYNIVKDSFKEYNKIGNEFLQNAKLSLERHDTKNAIDYLNFAYKNLPTNFEINFLLGSSYLSENDSMHGMIYLKQAYCINNNSLKTLELLTSACINVGDYTSAYCTMKRILPLVIHNQPEYLKTIQLIKDLGATFDEKSYVGHKAYADKYFDENNYHFALMEYENSIFLKKELKEELEERINRLKTFISPESDIIKKSLEEGGKSYITGDIRTSNKYFTRVMRLSSPESTEYKLAKSRVMNV